MFRELMSTRRFAPLFWTQFFSAFNDNFVRNMLAMLILFRVGESHAAPLVTLAIGLFILPSIVLSGVGGELADAHDKALIARRLKFAEIFVQMIAAAGFWFASLPLLFAALFGLGIIAALFGPIKYGILPDHLETRELPAGNALVEAATFVAILLGIVIGGFAAEEGRSPISVVLQLMAVALACWLASRFIPATRAAAPELRVDPNILASTGRLLTQLRADDRLWVGGLGLSVFWMIGAVALPLVAVLVKTRIGGGIAVETAVNALFAIGIAVGSVAAAMMAHGRILLAPVPFAALGMAAFLIDLGLATRGLKASGELSLAAFFASPQGVRVAIDVTGLAAMGGLYVVPLFSAVQAWAGEDRRARVIAGVNVLNAIFMVAGAGGAALMQSSMFGVGEPTLLVALGVFAIGAAIWLFVRFGANLAGDLLNLYFRIFHRVEVHGMEHVKAAGDRAVIALNHVSFLDAPLILSLLDEKPVFAIDSGIAKKWWVKPFLNIARVYPMDPTKPLGTRGLIQEVKNGHRLVIFPEGRITITGALMKVYDGAAMIADKADAAIVPVRIDGLEKSYFSRLAEGQVKRSLFPKTRVTFLPPRKLTIDAELKGRKRRHAAGAALYDVMSDLYFLTSRREQTLIEAFAESVREHGPSREMLEDPVTGKLSAKKTAIGAAVLGRKILGFTTKGEAVGLMLPNANGAAVTYFALQAAGRVPAMINYTAGAKNILAALAAAEVKTVLSSRAFVEKANLGGVVEALAESKKIVWLEDVRKGVGLVDKLRGLVEAGRALEKRDPADPAVILFTSGSEGTPKAVVLSHANIIANVQQIVARYDITAKDSVFNVLPVFHSFGMTGGMLLPMLTGMKLYLYPSPLHYRQIPELIYGSNSTVLFGTDTFLAGYARTANPYDFRSVRYVVAGAEPVKAETRRVYNEKFGLRILEGYGVTETSPVLAVNDPMFNRVGTVGRLMPGVDYRLESVPGITEGGRLHVRGPNVMLGYYRAERPGVLEPAPEGWHDTGDIVTVDAQKFVTIKGRAKRFAKIAGEMVSLAQVEQMLADFAPEHLIAMVSVPDARKGEKLIMVTTRADATRAAAQAHLKAKGATELMAPADVMIVDAIPLLGSGKTDYVQLDRLVRETLARAAA